MCDLIEANKHDAIDLIHCGEILITPNTLNFVVICRYCNAYFHHCNGFMRHILNGCHADALGIRQSQNDVDIYCVEELIEFEATANNLVMDDTENDFPSDTVANSNNHQDFAESLIAIVENDNEKEVTLKITGLAEYAELQEDSESVSLESECSHQQGSSIETYCDAMEDSAIDSLKVSTANRKHFDAPSENVNEVKDDVCDVLEDSAIDSSKSSTANSKHFDALSESIHGVKDDVCDILEDSAIDSLKVSNANSEHFDVLSENDHGVKYDVCDVLEDSAIDSLRSSTANSEHFDALLRNVHEVTYGSNDSFLKEIDVLLSAEEHSMKSQQKSKKSPPPQSLSTREQSVFQGKRKKCEMYEDDNDDANKENTPPKKLFAAQTPVNVDEMNTELIDLHSNMQSMPVKRRVSGNRPKLIRMSAAPGQVQLNSGLMIQRKTDNSDSSVLTNLKLMEHKVNDDQLSMNLTSETVNISSIQLDEDELASESNMEGINLLDASLVSLPERNDLDASMLAVTANPQQTLSTVESGNVDLLSKVGLRCIRTPSLDNTLTLAEEDAIHTRARVFAEGLQDCKSIWNRTINNNSEEVFRTLAIYLNTRLQINLNTKDLKEIINELFTWYQALHQNQLIKKKSPMKWLRYYLRLFAFLPKLTRFTMYCEECSASFRMKRDYAKHKEQNHNSTIEI